jgi:thioredoxin 1
MISRGFIRRLKTVTDSAAFKTHVLNSTKPVLVDFWAPWCGPCRALSPVLDKVVSKNEIELVKINTDDSPSLAEEYEVRMHRFFY